MADDRLSYVVMAVAVMVITRFLMSLYQARSRIIWLKKQGLVSTKSPVMGKLSSSSNLLTESSACLHITHSSAICLRSIAFYPTSRAMHIPYTYRINSDANILTWVRYSMWICGRSILQFFLLIPRPQHINFFRNTPFPKQTRYANSCTRWPETTT